MNTRFNFFNVVGLRHIVLIYLHFKIVNSFVSTGRSPGRPRRHRLAVQVARWCRAGVAARPERRGGIQQISPAGEVSPSSPRAGTVISQLRHRPGLAGRAARLKHLRKMRWQCEMVMWFGVSDVFARICTV